MADRKEASTTPVVPTVAGLAAAGMMAVGFGAGYGARAWNNSEAKRELIEKFPEQPTLEAEALARRGGFRAFAAGTALAGCMGVGAIFVARSYGITSMQQFGDEIKRWLPTKEALQGEMQPKVDQLQRTITEHIQGGRTAVERQFKNSSAGEFVRASASPKADTPLEPWEKELLAKLEGPAVPTK